MGVKYQRHSKSLILSIINDHGGEGFIVYDKLRFCKIDSDLWTIFLFYTQRLAFGMLCMIGLVIFDKTDD